MIEPKQRCDGGLPSARTHTLIVYEDGEHVGTIRAGLAPDGTTVHWQFSGRGADRTFEYESDEQELAMDVLDQLQQFVNGISGNVTVEYDAPAALFPAAVHTLANVERDSITRLSTKGHNHG